MLSIPLCVKSHWNQKIRTMIIQNPFFLTEEDKRRLAEETRDRYEKIKEKERKALDEIKRQERIDREYREAEKKDPWDFQILPEGWSPFGQIYIPIITEYYD